MDEVFEVYGRNNCSWCDAVKLLLERHKCQYTFYNIETDGNARETFIKRFPGAKTVPQVSIGNRWLGGYEETRDYFYGYN